MGNCYSSDHTAEDHVHTDHYQLLTVRLAGGKMQPCMHLPQRIKLLKSLSYYTCMYCAPTHDTIVASRSSNSRASDDY